MAGWLFCPPGEVLVRSAHGGLAILPGGRTLCEIDDILVICNERLEPEHRVVEVTEPRVARVSPQLDLVAVYSENCTLWICSLTSPKPIGSWQVATRPRGVEP